MGYLEDKRRARLFYRYLSHVYDHVNPFVWTEEMRSEALARLDITAGDVVLDVGCGTGFGTVGLLQHVEPVYGLDQSSAQLEKALAKPETARAVFMLGDAERLPFPDDTFDTVWSSGSIEYWPRPVTTLRELKRVARPGGSVLVVGPNEPRTRPMRMLADRIMLFYGRDEADEMFDRAGFESFEHLEHGPWYAPQIAITTIARVPTST